MANFFSILWSFVTSKLDTNSILLFACISAGAYLFWAIIDEDRSSLLRARLFKVFKFFTKSLDIDKRYISNDIKGRLNLARREIYCGSMILPKAIDVQWVDGQDPDAFEIKEGEFVVRLDPSTEQRQNIVSMAKVIVENTSLTGIRHIVEKPLQEAIDINLTRNLLLKSRNDDAVSWFYSNLFQPINEKEGELKNWNRKIIEIDEQMLFNTLLLVELEEFGRRISGMQPRPYMIGEITGFVNYLHRIATKREWENVNLDYRRAHLRAGTILVAKVDTVLNQGIEPYITAAKNHIKNKVHAVYLIVWGKPHLRAIGNSEFYRYNKLCGKLVKSIEKLDGVYKHIEVRKYTYIDPNGKRRSGRLVRYATDDNDQFACEIG